MIPKKNVLTCRLREYPVVPGVHSHGPATALSRSLVGVFTPLDPVYGSSPGVHGEDGSPATARGSEAHGTCSFPASENRTR